MKSENMHVVIGYCMKVSQINQTALKNTNRKQNKNNFQNINTQSNETAQPFKGAVDTFCLGIANAIENGGLAVSFTLQDMLGTNLPRPVMGLFRNKKENKGESNISFAAKELVREMLTGPSMFLIPMGMLAAGKKFLGKTTEVPMKIIKSFSEIHAANPVNQAGKAIGKQDFYKNVFSEVIKNAKGEEKITEETAKLADSFAFRLSTSNLQSKKIKKETIGNLVNEFSNLVKEHSHNPAYTDFTEATLSKTTKLPLSETVSHMVSYADDVVESAKNIEDVSKLKPYIEKVTNKKIITRFATNAAMYAAVIAFLQIIPKLYNKAEGKDNAGLKGLMKEETLNSATAVAQNDNTNKTNPSFGSLAGFTEKLTGNGRLGKFANACEFEGCNVSFPLLLGLMGIGILLPRTLQAKDKYDREEIVRRDLVTCATMCFAEKELRKGFSKVNEIKSGLVLAAKEENFKNKKLPQQIFDYLRPIKGVRLFTTDQIVSKYSNVDKYKDGISGFCEFIDNQGGSLRKVFSLTKQSKKIVSNILRKDGKSLVNADNSVIKKAIENAKDSQNVKDLTELFKDKNNPWVQQAKTLNARFTAFSVVVFVPLFLGMALPLLNAKATKKRVENENSQNNIQKTQDVVVNTPKNVNNSNVLQNLSKTSK